MICLYISVVLLFVIICICETFWNHSVLFYISDAYLKCMCIITKLKWILFYLDLSISQFQILLLYRGIQIKLVAHQ